jgi:hypothetical protein
MGMQQKELSYEKNQTVNFRVLDPGEFFKELLGRSSRTRVLLDPLANKASFSKYLLDTLKQ